MNLSELLEHPATEVGWSWNPHARLRCIDCGDEQPLGPAFNGCDHCSDGGEHAPLEVLYESLDQPHESELRSILRRLALYRQPIAPTKRVSLGRSPTPLVAVPGRIRIGSMSSTLELRSCSDPKEWSLARQATTGRPLPRMPLLRSCQLSFSAILRLRLRHCK